MLAYVGPMLAHVEPSWATALRPLPLTPEAGIGFAGGYDHIWIEFFPYLF